MSHQCYVETSHVVALRRHMSTCWIFTEGILCISFDQSYQYVCLSLNFLFLQMDLLNTHWPSWHMVISHSHLLLRAIWLHYLAAEKKAESSAVKNIHSVSVQQQQLQTTGFTVCSFNWIFVPEMSLFPFTQKTLKHDSYFKARSNIFLRSTQCMCLHYVWCMCEKEKERQRKEAGELPGWAFIILKCIKMSLGEKEAVWLLKN